MDCAHRHWVGEEPQWGPSGWQYWHYMDRCHRQICRCWKYELTSCLTCLTTFLTLRLSKTTHGCVVLTGSGIVFLLVTDAVISNTPLRIHNCRPSENSLRPSVTRFLFIQNRSWISSLTWGGVLLIIRFGKSCRLKTVIWYPCIWAFDAMGRWCPACLGH